MSEGQREVDAIMFQLTLEKLSSKHYNRIYEAVEVLLRADAKEHAQRLVRAIADLLTLPLAEDEEKKDG